MAGPIGMAIVGALVKLRCPHCGTVQARARAAQGTPSYRVCTKCHKHFDQVPSKKPAPRRR